MSGRRVMSNIVFIDLILNTLLGFVVLFILALLQIHPVEQKKNDENVVATEGEYVVIAQWPDGSADDVDLYVMDPTGKVAYFQGREAGLMHLEHDDLGSRNDSVTTNGITVGVDKNEERTILRGIVPGEYVVNVHMYNKYAGPTPTTVTVTLWRLKGADVEVAKAERVLVRSGDEATAFRFVLAADGSLVSTNDLPRRIVGKALGGRSGGGWHP